MIVLWFAVGFVVGCALIVSLVDHKVRRGGFKCPPPDLSTKPADLQTLHGGGWQWTCTQCCWYTFWSSGTCKWVWVPGGSGGGSGTQH